MSKFSQLTRKAKAYTIGGIELKLKARSLKDLDLLMELGDENKKNEALKKLIFVTLKESDSEASDEEIWDFGLEYFKEITEAVVDVNGLKGYKLSASD